MNNPMPDIDELIEQWRKGQLDADALHHLNKLLRENPEHRKLLLHDTALKQALSTERLQTRPHKTFQWTRWAAAAASILLCCYLWLQLTQEPAVGSIITFSPYQDRISLGNGRASILGSPQSQIRIVNNDEEIKIFLLHGSIHSTVTPQSGPFHVQTTSGTVSVTGTEFEVSLKDKEEDMKLQPFLVKVLAGSVLVSGSWPDTTLHAQEQSVFPPVEEKEIEVDDPIQIALNEKVTLSFKETALHDAIHMLQNQTPANLVVNPEVIEDKKKTVLLNLSNVKIRHVINAICWQNDLEDFLIVDDAVYITDNYPGRRKMQMHSLDGITNQSIDESFISLLKYSCLSLLEKDPHELILSKWNNKIAATATIKEHKLISDVLTIIASLDALDKLDFDIFVRVGKSWRPLHAHKQLNDLINIDFEDSSFHDVIDFISQNTKTNFNLHHSLTKDDMPGITLPANNLTLSTALRWIGEVTNTQWDIHNDIVYFGPKKKMPNSTMVYRLFGPEAEHDKLVNMLMAHGNLTDSDIMWKFTRNEFLIMHASPSIHSQFKSIYYKFKSENENGAK